MDRTVTIDAAGEHEFGGPSEPVTHVAATIVSGRVDVVTHGAASMLCEVHDIEGAPLVTTWAEGRFRLDGHKDERGQIFGAAKELLMGAARRRARVTLTVPAGARVAVNTVGADAFVGDVAGDVSVNTISGRVRLSCTSGRVDVKTVSGDVEAHSPGGDLRTTTVSGDVTVTAGRPRSVKVATTSGATTLDLRTGSCLVTVNSVSGDTTVRLPDDCGYDATATSRSGHVVVDGHTLSGGHSGERGGHRSDGDRSAAIKTRSLSGNIVVLRETVVDVQDVRPSERGPAGAPELRRQTSPEPGPETDL